MYKGFLYICRENSRVIEKKSDIGQLTSIFTEKKEQYIRFAFSYVYDRDIAEDLVMDSFMYCWENKEKLPVIENYSTYLLTIVKHKCLNHLQKQRTWNEVSQNILSDTEWELKMRISSLQSCEPEQIYNQELQQLLNKTLMQIPEKSRRIFNMSRQENMTYPKIAEKMHLSQKSVEFHISKVLNTLRTALSDYFPGLRKK